MKKAGTITATLGAVALALTGCAGESTPDTSPNGGSDELRVLKMISFPIMDFAPIWVAMDEGFFEEQGFLVEFGDNSSQSSADAASLLVSGEFQLGLSNIWNVAVAQSQGIELQVVSGNTVLGGPDDNSLQMVTKTDGPGSLAELGSDLVLGATGTPTQVYTMNAIDEAGGDSSGITFQTVPYPNAAELILNDSIVAHTMIEPFLTSALQNPELAAIGSVSAALPADSPSLSVVSSAEFAGENPEIVDGVRAALEKAMDWIADPANEETLLDLAAQYTGQDRDVLAGSGLPTFSTELTRAGVTEFLEMFQRYGQLDEVPDVDGLVAEGGYSS